MPRRRMGKWLASQMRKAAILFWRVAFAIGICVGVFAGFMDIAQPGGRQYLIVPLFVASIAWLWLHVYRWAPVVTGMFAWGIANSFLCLATGHTFAPPFRPQPRAFTIAFIAAMLAYNLANEAVRNRRSHTQIDRAALFTAFMIAMAGFAFTGDREFGGPASIGAGALLLGIVWLIGQKRHPARRRRTARAKAHPDSASTG